MGGNESQLDYCPLPETLVTQITEGQKQAEQELVSRYWRGLYFVLNRRTNDPDLAADLAQDTFIIVINKARNGEIKNPSALSAFIRQIGINLLIAHYRKETRHATEQNNDIHIQVPDDSPDLYRMLHSEQIYKVVTKLIDEMKVERDREILKSYFIREQDKAEICRILQLTPEHFDRVLHRARRRLKQLIDFNLGSDSLGHQLGDIRNVIVLFLLIGSMILPESVTSNQNFSQKIVREKMSWHHLIIQNINGHMINPDKELLSNSPNRLSRV